MNKEVSKLNHKTLNVKDWVIKGLCSVILHFVLFLKKVKTFGELTFPFLVCSYVTA